MNVDYTKRIDEYLKRLFPIARSITGDGNRATLKILQEVIPLEIKEYPSGNKVYDWEIPREWKLKEAWIKNSEGKKIIDFADSNLHVVGYSEPINKKLSFEELKDHLFYIENLPEAIPYRTSYYKKSWGFCLSLEQFKKFFREGETYEVLIDSEFKSGSLTVGEYLIPGRIKDEILISTYICHPSLANDNLSGAVMTAFLAEELQKRKLQHSFRVIFVPETIGAIAYCAFNEEAMKKIKSGFVVSCVGGENNYAYKQSFNISHPLNKIVEETFAGNSILNYKTCPFDPHGSDERQYSSQGFRINSVSIFRDRYYDYAYYHNSLDNIEFVKGENINRTLNLYIQAITAIDKINDTDLSVYRNPEVSCSKYTGKSATIFKNLLPYCEVKLGWRGLYPELGGAQRPVIANASELDMVLWLLFYCDGKISVGAIADKIKMDENELYRVALILEEKKLLKAV